MMINHSHRYLRFDLWIDESDFVVDKTPLLSGEDGEAGSGGY